MMNLGIAWNARSAAIPGKASEVIEPKFVPTGNILGRSADPEAAKFPVPFAGQRNPIPEQAWPAWWHRRC